MSTAPKKTKITLMPGESFWSKLIVADTKFKTEGEFSAVVRIPENSSLQALITPKEGKPYRADLKTTLALIDAEAEEALNEARGKAKTPAEAKRWATNYLPYKYVEDDNGDRTGEIEFKATMKASGVSKKTGRPWKMEPRLFDGGGNAIIGSRRSALRIGNGSVLIISVTIQPYAPTVQIGASVKLSLEAVQIIELKSGGADASSFGFAAVAGGFSATSIVDDEDAEDQVADDQDASADATDF